MTKAAQPARDSSSIPKSYSGKLEPAIESLLEPAIAQPEERPSELLWLAPSELTPWKDNPRNNDGEPVAKVAESIKRFGFGAPIVARADNREIIAGHTRWKAAKKLGLARVPVRLLPISEKEAHLLALADNRLTELTGWADAGLHDVLGRYDVADQLLAGWTEKDVRELERRAKGGEQVDDDDVPELPTDPITKLGDVWLLGKHRLVCGDSTSADVSKLACGELTPFIMVTDPPYGVDYDPEWRKRAGINNSDRMGVVANDTEASWKGAYELFSGDVGYVWCSALHQVVVANDLDALDFERRAQIIWVKPALVISRGHYHWQHEPCWYAVRSGRTSRWCGDRKQSTTWQIARKDADADATTHSTQKPVECMARPMRNHGSAGDVVYEPFAGSGTTVIAAEHLERICCAIELNPAYCDVVVERWQNLTGGKAERRAA